MGKVALELPCDIGFLLHKKAHVLSTLTGCTALLHCYQSMPESDNPKTLLGESKVINIH